jgi:hypothetical protein
LKKKGFEKERVTEVGWYDLGTSTTLESNKSHARKKCNGPVKALIMSYKSEL